MYDIQDNCLANDYNAICLYKLYENNDFGDNNYLIQVENIICPYK